MYEYVLIAMIWNGTVPTMVPTTAYYDVSSCINAGEALKTSLNYGGSKPPVIKYGCVSADPNFKSSSAVR